MRIVCDTNIWYGLGKGEIDPSIADSHELIITKLSLEEIATSENLISNILMVKKTFKVINKLAKGIIKENPFDYILKSYSHNYIPDNSHTDFIIEKIHQFVQVEDKILLAHSLSEDFRKSIINYDAELHYPTDKLNSLIPEIKANIKKATGKNKHRELDTEELIVELVKKELDLFIIFKMERS